MNYQFKMKKFNFYLCVAKNKKIKRHERFVDIKESQALDRFFFNINRDEKKNKCLNYICK